MLKQKYWYKTKKIKQKTKQRRAELFQYVLECLDCSRMEEENERETVTGI